MYSAVLIAHSWIRWIAILLGVVTTIAAIANRGSSSAADRWGLIFMMVLDIQMLLGLLLYLVLSPFTAEALKNFGAAMRNPALRFWAVEHTSLMVAAVILARRLGARDGADAASKRRVRSCATRWQRSR
jgi:hypothetical protein